jgi:hypothetical protein
MSEEKEGATVLKNRRDDSGRVLCPVCNAPITDARILQAGHFAYHRDCWRPTEYPAEPN